MNRFTIEVHTYSNNQKVYCPILTNEKDTYFITKDGKYPIPSTAPRYNSLFKQYGYLTMEEAQRTIDMYLDNSNICFREESYQYNPIQQKSIKIGGFSSQQVIDIRNLLINIGVPEDVMNIYEQ